MLVSIVRNTNCYFLLSLLCWQGKGLLPINNMQALLQLQYGIYLYTVFIILLEFLMVFFRFTFSKEYNSLLNIYSNNAFFIYWAALILQLFDWPCLDHPCLLLWNQNITISHHRLLSYKKFHLNIQRQYYKSF